MEVFPQEKFFIRHYFVFIGKSCDSCDGWYRRCDMQVGVLALPGAMTRTGPYGFALLLYFTSREITFFSPEWFPVHAIFLTAHILVHFSNTPSTQFLKLLQPLCNICLTLKSSQSTRCLWAPDWGCAGSWWRKGLRNIKNRSGLITLNYITSFLPACRVGSSADCTFKTDLKTGACSAGTPTWWLQRRRGTPSVHCGGGSSGLSKLFITILL